MAANEVKLPPGMPLFATTTETSRLFGVGRTKLFQLRRDHPELKAMTVKTGRDVLYDVAAVYKWFQDRCGGELE
jgi:hypothetical protein